MRIKHTGQRFFQLRPTTDTPPSPADGAALGQHIKYIAYAGGREIEAKPVPVITRRDAIRAHVAKARDLEIEMWVDAHIAAYGGDAWFDGAGMPVCIDDVNRGLKAMLSTV